MQPPELYPHQKLAVEKMGNGKILYGGVGSGKSLTAVAYYVAKESPRPVVVITTAKKRDALDWEKEFVQYNIYKTKDTTAHGVLTVDSWNNIGKYVGWVGAFFILDEQRLVGSGAWVKSFRKIAKHNHWIILSATPGDTWMDYVPVFVANGFYKNRTEFIDKHVVYAAYSKFPKVDHYVDTGKLMQYRAKLLVHMPYKNHTTRHAITLHMDYDEKRMDTVIKDRWNPFTEEPIKNISEFSMCMRRVTYEDLTRLEAVLQLTAKHPRLIVFYNFNFELEALRMLGSMLEDTTVAEWNGHKHEEVPNTDRWVYLVQYTAGAEGWNCITTDAIVFYSLTYSWKQWHQAHGRIDRLNTLFKDLYYYTLLSKAPIDSAVKQTLNEKKDFNETAYAAKVGWFNRKK